MEKVLVSIHLFWLYFMNGYEVHPSIQRKLQKIFLRVCFFFWKYFWFFLVSPKNRLQVLRLWLWIFKNKFYSKSFSSVAIACKLLKKVIDRIFIHIFCSERTCTSEYPDNVNYFSASFELSPSLIFLLFRFNWSLYSTFVDDRWTWESWPPARSIESRTRPLCSRHRASTPPWTTPTLIPA